MKKALLVLLLLSIYGCDDLDPKRKIDISVPTDGGHMDFEIICIDGVQYYKNIYSAAFAPAFDRDGKIKTCNK
jgi:hypothetical protein